MTAGAIMVLGTTSGAGKSWLATALCRWYARQGLRVAPFKAQNMSNNARVVSLPDGSTGEIGSAQYFQALAAGARPDTRMNPILLKPESDCSSQVIVAGRVRPDLAALPWRERSAVLWPVARAALHELLAENDLVVIEGAGSPAEINLHASDYVNMRTAREAHAACLLIADIDRGGAFAHLFGTHQLLAADERALIRGFVLNRFRGDAALLSPGPEELERLTGIPTVAVLPMWREHGLPEEDGVFEMDAPGRAPGALHIAIVGYPRISNLDEFQSLRHHPSINVRWVRTPVEAEGADWIILPGSKHVSSDLEWLRNQQLDTIVKLHAIAGKPVLGVCGGMQMLGEAMTDPAGVDGQARGLGLLPLRTTFASQKLLRPTRASFERLEGPWRALAGLTFDAYEIRHGRSSCSGDVDDVHTALRNDCGEAIGWRRGSVLGISAHGLFESAPAMQSLFGIDSRPLEAVFDGLADFVDRHFKPGALLRLLHALPMKALP